MGDLQIEWRIVPRHAPVVTRRCARCDAPRSFSSSGKFRVNAAGRKIDVWLIYKCHSCKQTWNATILTRVAPESIDPDLYQRFLNNDSATINRYAFDFDFLKSNDAVFDPKMDYKVEGDDVPADATSGKAHLLVRFLFPVTVRLETLLANQLGISRSKLERMHEEGSLVFEDGDKLSKKIKPEMRATVDLAALAIARGH